MFVNTLDNKLEYRDNDSIDIIDLGESIFKTSINGSSVYSYYRVGRGMDMRPDKVSYAAYGEDDYAEMVMKYSLIDNPFALMEGDIIAVPTLNSVYEDVKELFIERQKGDTTYSRIRNYHKYIDKSKIPTINGSTGSSIGKTVEEKQTISSNVSNQNDYDFQSLGIRNSYGHVMGYGSEYNLSDDANDNTVKNQGNQTNLMKGRRISSNDENGVEGYSGNSSGVSSGLSANTNSYTGIAYDDDELPTMYDANGVPIIYGEDGLPIYPETEGNENILSQNGPVEANLANNNKSGITLVNGRLIFGDSNVSVNPNDVTDIDGTNEIDNPFIDCARAGVPLGRFISATIKNNLKGS